MLLLPILKPICLVKGHDYDFCFIDEDEINDIGPSLFCRRCGKSDFYICITTEMIDDAIYDNNESRFLLTGFKL